MKQLLKYFFIILLFIFSIYYTDKSVDILKLNDPIMKEIKNNLLSVNYEINNIKVTGLVGSPGLSRSTREFENYYVNKRYVKSKIIQSALESAYKTSLMVGRFPVAILYIDINPLRIDVNVHPSKMEIKFSDDKVVWDAVYWAVKNALFSVSKEREVYVKEEKEEKPKEIFSYVNDPLLKKESTINEEIMSIFKNEEVIEEKDEKKEFIFENDNALFIFFVSPF